MKKLELAGKNQGSPYSDINMLPYIEGSIFKYSRRRDVSALMKRETEILHTSDYVKWVFTPLTEIKGIGKTTLNRLSKNHIETIYDILNVIPAKYDFYSHLTPIGQLNEGTYAVRGKVGAKEDRKAYFFLRIEDDTGFLYCKWFNITPFLKKILQSIKTGDEVVVWGKVSHFGIFWEMHHPLIAKEFKKRVDITYPTIGGLESKKISRIIENVLSKAPPLFDYLPYFIIKKRKFPFLSEMLKSIHLPEKPPQIEIYKKRLRYEELFLLNLAYQKIKQENKEKKTTTININDKMLQTLESKLPFRLTHAQQRALKEIVSDLKKDHPMMRLLQGDVGSGKTAVVAIAAACVAKEGYQVSFMVPTEVLAIQHYEKLLPFFSSCNVSCEILVGSTPKKKKEKILSLLSQGKIDILIGTHALFQEGVNFKNMTLSIIDEQHKFGVEQRNRLMKKGTSPHTLILSATPIPRTLCLALYGDMDISIIDELPPGRKGVKSFMLTKKRRKEAYEFVLKQVKKGKQAYVVYPLISESENIPDVDAAEEMYKKLKETYFENIRLGLLHGGMSSDEKMKVGELFRKGEIDVLISTTVIEVGVDVENATTMVVENAEKFGLAQLHQLRGRVRRSKYQSYSYFILGDNASSLARRRIGYLCSIDDGFKLAEIDFRLRGAGDILGIRQHGIPNLVHADLIRDSMVLKQAKKDVEIMEKYNYPISEELMYILKKKWEKSLCYLQVG